MKRALCLVSVLCLLLCAAAQTEALDSTRWIAELCRQYPDWRVWQKRGHIARDRYTIDVSLFKVEGQALRCRRFTGVAASDSGASPIWTAGDYAPIPLSGEAAVRLSSMSADCIFYRASGADLKDEALPGCAGFLLLPGETLTSLFAYPRHLVGVTKDENKRYTLVIADWDGERYTAVTRAKPQTHSPWIHYLHSYNDNLEIEVTDYGLALQYNPLSGWQMVTTVGSDVYHYFEDGFIDCEIGDIKCSNDGYHYGALPFGTALQELDFEFIGQYLNDLPAYADASDYACTRGDGTLMYTVPNGERFAECYARTAGRITAQDGEWVCLRIGDDESGMDGWFKKDDLAFGAEVNTAVCGYPYYENDLYDDKATADLTRALTGCCLAASDIDTVWLIGRLSGGGWLVQVNQTHICTAKEDAFFGIGPALHSEAFLEALYGADETPEPAEDDAIEMP